jgi:hypothetical protein
MWIDLEDWLLELRGSHLGVAQAEDIKKLRKLYPSLRAFKDRNGMVKLTSCEANQHVDEVDFIYRSDLPAASLEAWMSLVDDGHRIYSDPPNVLIGVKNPNGFGIHSLEDWRNGFEYAGICKSMLLKAKDYLESHQAVDYELDDVEGV